MGKYFKEDNNQRITKIAQSVDVDSLAKRLIVAQGAVFRLFGKGAPAKSLKPGVAPERLFGHSSPNGYVQIDPGDPAMKYTKTLRQTLLGKLVDFLIPSKLKIMKDFMLELNTGGAFDKVLSKKIDERLNKAYNLRPKGKGPATGVQLRTLINNFDPSSGTLNGREYIFTPSNIDEIYDDLKFITQQADKLARIKAGVAGGLAGTGVGLLNIGQAQDRGTPQVKKMHTDVENIMNKTQSTIDDSTNPLDKKKGK